ncbi:uncharacterized protein BDR25DRAFT_394944 [Lindgomyces ingoldianus]|uniref:Uncharacterized protein n=1 Tax=Lindgomyces ingoldianus TaxID=673940 RepID=A0ACB6QMR4_9PLEO|nr:uncharacterized protein BDR25DRAFT_394944 [Lindgomyces ingoldianus]KAF2468191.1 hypothetical protein BDR25DRAFT_394944 [Lindgomyces ingoldianus]
MEAMVNSDYQLHVKVEIEKITNQAVCDGLCDMSSASSFVSAIFAKANVLSNLILSWHSSIEVGDHSVSTAGRTMGPWFNKQPATATECRQPVVFQDGGRLRGGQNLQRTVAKESMNTSPIRSALDLCPTGDAPHCSKKVFEFFYWRSLSILHHHDASTRRPTQGFPSAADAHPRLSSVLIVGLLHCMNLISEGSKMPSSLLAPANSFSLIDHATRDFTTSLSNETPSLYHIALGQGVQSLKYHKGLVRKMLAHTPRRSLTFHISTNHILTELVINRWSAQCTSPQTFPLSRPSSKTTSSFAEPLPHRKPVGNPKIAFPAAMLPHAVTNRQSVLLGFNREKAFPLILEGRRCAPSPLWGSYDAIPLTRALEDSAMDLAEKGLPIRAPPNQNLFEVFAPRRLTPNRQPSSFVPDPPALTGRTGCSNSILCPAKPAISAAFIQSISLTLALDEAGSQQNPKRVFVASDFVSEFFEFFWQAKLTVGPSRG